MVALKELFTIKYGVNLEFNTMHEVNGGLPFVARGSQNNGVVGYVKRIGGLTPNPSMTISVSASGSVMESFLQEKEYYSGRDLYYLQPKVKLSKNEMLYYCMILKQNKYRYSYGRQANKTIDNLLVPSIKEIPDWVYTAKLPRKPSDKLFFNKQINLTDRDWEFSKVDQIFEKIESGKCSNARALLNNGNDLFYIGAKRANNGVMQRVENVTELVSKGNSIVFIGDGQGSVGYCTYQPEDFIGSTTLNVGYSANLNPITAMFLITLLDLEFFRYSFGRKYSPKHVKATQLKLPVSSPHTIDWQFMEDYIKSLPYSFNL